MSTMHDVGEVAAILGLQPQTIRELIASRELPAVDVSIKQHKPRWRIPDESLQRFIRQRATVASQANG